ncbi:LacI family DNA-binding transcriptional regulator [Klebsiella indica]|uniref:LacI family transcriptional regulator n=1 Tax=Klebsiella indica TaxID=2582917 RepID=A0A5R9LDM7_9ENTR|nr:MULTISPECIES: LacI family DNA-binding transcriptional regulator [Klebsiella]TLV11684.1 LacI family transcriptional regulator [Klebsiella indica]
MSAKKVTMTDIARDAKVGIATVDRVLNKRTPVKASTERKVLEAARRLGFALEQSRYRQAGGQSAVTLRMGFILLQQSHSFYHQLAQMLEQAAMPWHNPTQPPVFLHYDINAIDDMVAAIDRLSDEVDVIGIVALDNPLIRHAITQAIDKGVRVFTLLSDMAVAQRTGYIGLDNQKAGRTAGWAIDRLCRHEGEIGIIIGDNRFICQESCEISFRSYLREHGKGERVLEPVRSYERADIARQVTDAMLRDYPSLTAIYAPCGGVEGIIDALQAHQRQHQVMLICHGPVENGELALIDGTIDLMITHRLPALADATINAFLQASGQSQATFINALQPFDLLTKENL